MNVTRTGDGSFAAEFESEQEVRDEHGSNLSFGALRLATAESVAPDSALQVTLRGPWGGEIAVSAKMVAQLPDGIALAVEGDPGEMLAALLARPPEDGGVEEPAAAAQNPWDRVRALSH